MTNPLMPRITIELGSHRRTVLASELAAAVGRAGVLAAVTDLLFQTAPDLAAGEERGKGREGVPRLPETNERQKNQEAFVPGEGGKGSRGREGEADASASALAAHLADALHDPRSLPFYQLVARTVPHDAVRDALQRTLDVRPQDIRRSRAAYFTALVKPLLGSRRPGAARRRA